MEVLIAFFVFGLVIYYLSNNSSSTKTTTKIIKTETINTANGKVTLEQTTVTTDATLEIKPIQSNISNFPQGNTFNIPSRSSITEIKSVATSPLSPSSGFNQNFSALPNKSPTDTQSQFKICSGCQRKQPLSEFRPNSNQPDGLTKWCIKCLNQPKLKPLTGMKHCPKCKQNRRKTSFYPTTKYPDGLSKWCKFCLDRH